MLLLLTFLFYSIFFIFCTVSSNYITNLTEHTNARYHFFLNIHFILSIQKSFCRFLIEKLKKCR